MPPSPFIAQLRPLLRQRFNRPSHEQGIDRLLEETRYQTCHNKAQSGSYENVEPRSVIETAISGLDEGQPAEQRDYVQAICAEPNAERKLKIDTTALGSIQPRLAPLFAVLQAAAPLDSDLRALWSEVSDRRARNMRLLASELAETGQLRKELSVDVVADIIWSMNSPDYYLLLVEQRGWSPGDFQDWLADAWMRLLLDTR